MAIQLKPVADMHAYNMYYVYADENNCQGTCIIFLVVLVRGGGEGERERER